MSKQGELWSHIISSASPDSLLYMALQHAAHTFSDMVKHPFKINNLRLQRRTINEITGPDKDPEAATIGIYLHLSKDLPGETIFILSQADAEYLTEWLLEADPGTTTILGDVERSALAEVGNQMLSSFLNALAEFTGISLTLSPPIVRVDMLATILEAAIMPLVTVTDELLIVETDFISVESNLIIQCWMLPDVSVLRAG